MKNGKVTTPAWRKIYVSPGNSKLGKIPSFSFPPILTCRPDVECRDACYDMGSWKQYPAVRMSRLMNYWVWKCIPDAVLVQLRQYMAKHKPERFRWMVGGDVDQYFFKDIIVPLAREFPGVRYLLFTKNHPVTHYYPMGGIKNLKVRMSQWPGMLSTHLHDGPLHPNAWMHDPKNVDTRIPKTAKKCPGSCESCSMCFTSNKDVVFTKH